MLRPEIEVQAYIRTRRVASVRRLAASVLSMMCAALLAPATLHAASVLYAIGAMNVAPIVSSAASVWHKQHPEVTIVVSGKRTGDGITAVIRGIAAIGMVARELEAVEIAMLAERVDVYAIAKTISATSPAYNGRRNLYVLLRKDAPATARAFVDFLRSPQGQAIIRAAGYLPVR